MSLQEFKEIQPIIKRIVEGYAPQKIFLFGSRAWGTPTVDSDYDFVIIKKGKKNFFTEAYKVRRLINGQIAADILIYTPREFEDRAKEGDLFLQEIIKNGKCLYEK